MEFDVNKVIDNLKNSDYPLFVSERHLQVAFILEASKLYPKYQYLPEYAYEENDKDYHIDLLVCDGDKESIAFEFKYVVAGGVINVPGCSNYELRNHSAIDIRRYQCVRDISRLETYTKSKTLNCNKGYFILITNMSKFWEGSSKNSVAVQFDISNGSCLKKGIHKLKDESSIAKKYKPIKIDNNYSVNYSDYKEIEEKNGSFKVLCLEI